MSLLHGQRIYGDLGRFSCRMSVKADSFLMGARRVALKEEGDLLYYYETCQDTCPDELGARGVYLVLLD